MIIGDEVQDEISAVHVQDSIDEGIDVFGVLVGGSWIDFGSGAGIGKRRKRQTSSGNNVPFTNTYQSSTHAGLTSVSARVATSVILGIGPGTTGDSACTGRYGTMDHARFLKKTGLYHASFLA